MAKIWLEIRKIWVRLDPSEQYSGVRNQDRGTITKEPLKDLYCRKVANVDFAREQFTQYAIGTKEVLYNGVKIKNANRSRFELVVGLLDFYPMKGGVSYEYARDDQSAYYKGTRMENADRNTLLPVSENPAYATDKTQVFFEGKIIPNADPATFEPLWYPIYEGCLLGAYAKDAHAVFYKNQTVEGADFNSWNSLYNEYGRDKKRIYLKGIFHPEINPQTFTPPMCDYG